MRKKEEQMKRIVPDRLSPTNTRTANSNSTNRGTRSSAYCCFPFRESVIVDKTIIRATRYDETAWHLPQGMHIYFCPFCGHKVKGKGFGTYKQAALTVEEMRALRKQTASRTAKSLGQKRGK